MKGITMRELSCAQLQAAVRDLFLQANRRITPDIRAAMVSARATSCIPVSNTYS